MYEKKEKKEKKKKKKEVGRWGGVILWGVALASTCI